MENPSSKEVCVPDTPLEGDCGMLREEEIYEVEASKDEMRRWVRKCFDKVKERGELDNLSCIVVKVS